MSDYQVPEKLDYSGTPNAFKAAERKAMKDNVYMPTEVVGVRKGVTGKGNLALNLDLGALDGEGNVIRAATRSLDVYPNLINPTVAGHERPNTFIGCYCLCIALDETFPRLAHKAGTTGFYETADGRRITKTEANAIRERVELAVQHKMAEYWDDPSLLMGKRMYAKLEKVKDLKDDTKVFEKFTRTINDKSQLKAGESVIEDGNVFVQEEAPV